MHTHARKHKRAAFSFPRVGRQEHVSYQGYNLDDLCDQLEVLVARRAKLENDYCLAAMASGAKEEAARANVIIARKVPQTNELMRIISEAHSAVLALEKVIDEKKHTDSATVYSDRVSTVSTADSCICTYLCAWVLCVGEIISLQVVSIHKTDVPAADVGIKDCNSFHSTPTR